VFKKSHAPQVLAKMPDGAASPLRGASPAPGPRAASAQSSPLTNRSARHGSALGCAGRTSARIRDLARGGRRVVPVAGHDASAAGVSRRDGPNPHLQATTGRSPIQPHMPCAPQPVRPARPPGNQCAPRGDTAALSPLYKEPGAKASTQAWSSCSAGGPGGMRGPRAPHVRDTAVLRHDSRHPGMAARRRSPTSSAQNRGKLKEEGRR
jgi:hypothetical protein